MHFAFVAIAILFATMTVIQASPYRNDVALFEYVYTVAPNNVLVKQLLGMSYLRARRHTEGIAVLQSMYTPNDYACEHLLGTAYFSAEDYLHAEPFLKRAALMPAKEGIETEKDFDFATLGLAQYHLNEFEDSEKSMRAAIALAPQQNGYHYALGRILETEKKYPAARAEYQLELTIDADPLSQEGIARMTAILQDDKGQKR